jgi:hypothetical protein
MNSLEIEIHTLFQENASLDYVCQELLSKYEKNETLSSLEVQGLSHFLVQAKRFDLLKKFYAKCLRQKKIAQLPLGFIAEAIRANNLPVTEEIASFFEYMVQAQPDEITTLQSDVVRQYSKEIEQRFQNLKVDFQKERQELKVKLIEQLTKNRLYQMSDQEQVVLDQLTGLFPNDIEVGILKQAQLERKADEILSRFVAKKTLTKPKNPNAEMSNDVDGNKIIMDLEANIRTLAAKLEMDSPDQLYNLSILAYQFDFYDLTLEILDKTPQTHSRDWLKAEVLHDCGRFLDLIKLIESLESSKEAKPEDTHGAVYLKALAYYGLGQKDLAIRLLNSLSRAVPFYRSTEALLHEWKQT